MKVTGVETLHADGGGRNFDFLKLSTDEGIVGWSEFNENFGGVGVAATIAGLADAVLGVDPRAVQRVVARLRASRRPALSGIAAQAIGAIENAMLDVAAKSLGVPVYRLYGGPHRTSIELYWSHCGMYRVRWHEEMSVPPVRELGDLVRLGAEVVDRGFRAMKANVILFGDGPPRVHAPGFSGPGAFPELTVTPDLIAAIREQLSALRDGANGKASVALDLNFNFRADGSAAVARAIAGLDPLWLELDGLDPPSLRFLRDTSAVPVASGETLYGRREVMPFLDARGVDILVVDVPMNGFAEAVRMAEMAEAHEVNVAPHNFYGPLANLMTAHFCATVPNLAVMELDGDTAPWYDDLVTSPGRVEDGRFVLSDAPGWGADVNEEAIREHPARG